MAIAEDVLMKDVLSIIRLPSWSVCPSFPRLGQSFESGHAIAAPPNKGQTTSATLTRHRNRRSIDGAQAGADERVAEGVLSVLAALQKSSSTDCLHYCAVARVPE